MTVRIPQSEIRNSLRQAYRRLDDPLFDRCIASIPAVPPHALCYFEDGNKRCCVFGDFRNLMEDPAGFGDSDAEAYQDLRRQVQCEACEGTGRVTMSNEVVVDRGTRWQRSAVETVNEECQECNGIGTKPTT